MPQIKVLSDAGVVLSEHVSLADLESGSNAAGLVERIGWAVYDADETTSRRSIPKTSEFGDVDHSVSPLAEVAHAIREHEGATRRSMHAPRSADHRLYRRLRQALGR